MMRYVLNVFLTFSAFYLVSSEGQLLSVAVIFRHGDRTPSYVYPNDPYNNTFFNYTQPGELTNAGKLRQYNLGVFLRNRYKDFLPDKYSKDDIYILADDMDRCLMSASSLLSGLYPPKNEDQWGGLNDWQPIPIHISTYLLWGEPNDCKKYYDQKAKIYESNWMKQINRENVELYKFLSNATGMEVANLDDIKKIQQLLYIEQELNLELPEWSRDIFPEILDNLTAINLWVQTNNTEMAKFSAGPLLNDVLNNFEENKLKMSLYSGHDTNVAQTVQTLSPDTDKFCPEFSSAAILELWQNEDQLFIKLYLKRDEVLSEVSLLECGVNCGYNDFKRIFKDILVDDKKWNKDCNPKVSGTVAITYVAWFNWIVLMAICILLQFIYN